MVMVKNCWSKTVDHICILLDTLVETIQIALPPPPSKLDLLHVTFHIVSFRTRLCLLTALLHLRSLPRTALLHLLSLPRICVSLTLPRLCQLFCGNHI